MWRRVGALGEVASIAAPSGEYVMVWSPGGQVMAHGSDAFAHEGPINTAPSHDLAHLLVAAAGPSLEWRPSGDHDKICLAEYNAVAHEHLLDRVYRAVVGREGQLEQIVPALTKHLEWFATKHFIPFPITPRQALQQYVGGLSDDSAVRLSPYFFQMKHGERLDPSFMKGTWTARLRDSDQPLGWEQLKTMVGAQFGLLRAAAAA